MTPRSRWARSPAALLALCALLLHGCEGLGTGLGGEDEVVPTTVNVSPSIASLLALGDQVQLGAEVLDQNGDVMSGESVAWTSTDPTVATVDAQGLVTAVAVGMVQVEASAGDVTGSAQVQVNQEAAQVVVSPAADTLLVGDTLELAVEVQDRNGSEIDAPAVDWQSSNPSILELIPTDTGTAMVAALQSGSATIEVFAGTASGAAELLSLGLVIDVTPDSVALAPDDATTLTATVEDDLGRPVTDRQLSWTSSDETIVTVDAAGALTPQTTAGGTAQVFAALGDASAVAEVRVLSSTQTPTLDLAQDSAVGGFAEGATSVPTMPQELADVEATMARGNLEAAQTEVAEVRTLLDNALATATGTERILLVALDLIVDQMEAALRSVAAVNR